MAWMVGRCVLCATFSVQCYTKLKCEHSKWLYRGLWSYLTDVHNHTDIVNKLLLNIARVHNNATVLHRWCYVRAMNKSLTWINAVPVTSPSLIFLACFYLRRIKIEMFSSNSRQWLACDHVISLSAHWMDTREIATKEREI